MIRPQTCPICDRELTADAAVSSRLFPFCSERCRQIDLYRWSEGRYGLVDPLAPDDPRLTPEGDRNAPEDEDG